MILFTMFTAMVAKSLKNNCLFALHTFLTLRSNGQDNFSPVNEAGFFNSALVIFFFNFDTF